MATGEFLGHKTCDYNIVVHERKLINIFYIHGVS